jgi:hypothetical protein
VLYVCVFFVVGIIYMYISTGGCLVSVCVFCGGRLYQGYSVGVELGG